MSLFPKIVFVLANSADPDEMPPYAAFHLGLLCLSKYLFTTTFLPVSRMKLVKVFSQQNSSKAV